MSEPRQVKIRLDRALASDLPEVGYVLRSLLRIAGLPFELRWSDDPSDETDAPDLYYGRIRDDERARLSIPWCGRSFKDAPRLDPIRLHDDGPIPFLDFGDPPVASTFPTKDGRSLPGDILFASFWLLSGAREHTYVRDRWDNFDLDGSFFLENNLGSQPLVSIYGAFLREHFGELGYAPLQAPWARMPGTTAFALSHDVDYPEMIRWIECLRLLRARGISGVSSIAGVLRGTNHFWRFDDWLAFARKYDARPAYYFMARQGSLFQYATGTPDAFYDVTSPKFRRLLRTLVDEGCEIGLHASFNAHRSVEQLHREKEIIEDVAQVEITGNRHHYWHLDPLQPHETLDRHIQAGFQYDSSLEYDFYPGFRRGVCHPFRPFHTEQRRELPIVELPPTWMDDHFDRRLTHNQISDPMAYAKHLLAICTQTGGVAVVNYHVRGMNADFYPRYGPWLDAFLQDYQDTQLEFSTPSAIVNQYTTFEHELEQRSTDFTNPELATR